MLETISGYPPFEGSEPCPVGQGRYGVDDQMRNQQAMTPGMAVSRQNTTSNANRRNIYIFGHASASPEFYGVMFTKGAAPTLQVSASSTNADVVSVIYEGYAPCLLAPGQVVKPDQWIEPIPSGTYQGLFRLADGAKGVAQVRDYLDNTGGSAGVWVGADIIKAPRGSGLLSGGAVGPSADLTGFAVETAYNVTRTIPANTLRAGDRFRIVGTALSNNIAAGNNTVKGYINGIGSGVLFTAPAVTFAASDVVSFIIEIYVASLSGSNNVSIAGFVTAGTPGTATARAVSGLLTLVPTANNVITIANTPNNSADSSKLLFLSVEKLAA